MLLMLTNEDSQRPHLNTVHVNQAPSHLKAARATILSNVRTAMPVGPFDLYGFASSPQAVPAMSRWAHETPSANSLRNAAAVMVPALRPPTFLISAMSDLICLEYSLSNGSCQNFSPASFPATMISSISS